MRLSTFILAISAAFVNANPRSADSGPPHNNFTSTKIQDVNLRYVLNSGVCETTPGVQQMSGYIDTNKDGSNSMWFWFVEAKSDAEKAPLTAWLGGGLGCSSMMGFLQEHGPCTVNLDGKDTTLNSFSWNNISNMIYLDHLPNTGMSYGSGEVRRTEDALLPFWEAMQVLFESKAFSKYKKREIIMASQGYGSKLAISYVTFFNKQNALINSKKLKGELIKVKAIMILNGWIEPLLQNEAYVAIATNAPGHGPLQDETVIKQINMAFYGKGGCKDKLTACYDAVNTTRWDDTCSDADYYCDDEVFVPTVRNLDPYDFTKDSNEASEFPSRSYLKFLSNSQIMKKIGAETSYTECTHLRDVFTNTGDDSKTVLPDLEQLANLKIKLFLLYGELDIVTNWLGGHALVQAMDRYGKKFQDMKFTNMTIGGPQNVVAGYKNVENLSFARMRDAGRPISVYNPKATFEMFRQLVDNEQLHSVP